LWLASRTNSRHAGFASGCRAAIETYNPLFLYGGVGMAKTHLMHAIGHTIKQPKPGARAAELRQPRKNLTIEVINSLRFDKMFSFRERFSSLWMCVLWTIPVFIAGKERTQEEFFTRSTVV